MLIIITTVNNTLGHTNCKYNHRQLLASGNSTHVVAIF